MRLALKNIALTLSPFFDRLKNCFTRLLHNPRLNPKNPDPPKPPFLLSATPSLFNQSFASQRPLLAVIFSSENAPDCQTGFEPGISQNNSAAFSRISDIFGVGTPSWNDSLRRRSGAGKRVGFLPVLRGIPDPQNSLPFISPSSSP